MDNFQHVLVIFNKKKSSFNSSSNISRTMVSKILIFGLFFKIDLIVNKIPAILF